MCIVVVGGVVEASQKSSWAVYQQEYTDQWGLLFVLHLGKLNNVHAAEVILILHSIALVHVKHGN